MDGAVLLWGLLFSSIGLALMVYPYFVGSAGWVVAIGVVLTAIPYFVRL